MFGLKRVIKRRNGYIEFIHKQLNLPYKPKYKNKEYLRYLQYDIVIYGSDQIWRRSKYPSFKGYNEVYFGAYPIIVKRKISYAASMGVIDVKEHEEHYLKSMFNNFNSISVRETELKQLVEHISSHSASLVLDPVFLLKKSDWLQYISPIKFTSKEKYIFFYQLTPSQEAIAFTNKLEKHFGYKVIEIRGRVNPFLIGKRYFQTATPFDFISLIQSAEIVVSTSFHGVAFSLLFEKQFYALGMKDNSGRVQSLLNNFNIPSRLVTDINHVSYNEKINYEVLNIRKTVLEQQSFNFLINAIG